VTVRNKYSTQLEKGFQGFQGFQAAFYIRPPPQLLDFWTARGKESDREVEREYFDRESIQGRVREGIEDGRQGKIRLVQSRKGRVPKGDSQDTEGGERESCSGGNESQGVEY
jgi:hypothetical protein